MAGDWIPMRMDLLEDPSVLAIGSTLGIDEYAVVGRLLKLWSWANRHLKNGCASVALEWIDRHVGTTGFASAMLNAGWLRTRSSGSLEFTNFDRWNSQGAKVRILAAQRMRKARCQKRDGPSATKAQPEKRREERGRPNGLPPPDKPAKEKTAPRGRERNPIFDALAEVTGVDASIRSQAKTLGVKSAELAAAEPPYSPEEIFEFGRRFLDLCSWARKDGRERPTPGELVKWIHLVRAKSPAPKVKSTFDPFQNAPEKST